MTELKTGTKTILALMGLALAAMFVFSFLYRMSNPSLTMHVEAQDTAHGQQEMMAQVGMLMQELQSNPEDIEILKSLGEAFLIMESWDRAVAFFQRALNVDANDPETRSQLAMAYFRLGEHGLAAEQLEAAMKLDPGDTTYNYNLGILYKHYLDQPQWAREHFQKVVDDPDAKPELKAQAEKELAG